MMCGNAKEWMAAAWSGELDEATEERLRRHLAGCAECSAEMAELGGLWERLGDLPAPEPSMAQHVRWQATMDSLRPARQSGTVARRAAAVNSWKFSLNALWPGRPVWQATIAAGCLIAGLLIGAYAGRGRSDAGEIAKLRNEVASTREMVALSLLGQQSATERLRGVDYSVRMPTLEPRVVSALIEAVNRDSNVNVRLAAIDALSRAAASTEVRQSMAASLAQQDSPMVQAALIDYLVDARASGAAETLREFSRRADLNIAVKQHAALALRELTEYR